ncbi:hypothetical protein DEO72_LG2g5215 [Vigna unguiculata]|uniref:Uncharacterized protein n=1 Tax=Vigna unguiculata TaxID=3917 RepID=A0A4D6L8J9_VIGUN|nr:hypothetical protein DEO72_LG2g5215 [Vigna unguiculata]
MKNRSNRSNRSNPPRGNSNTKTFLRLASDEKHEPIKVHEAEEVVAPFNDISTTRQDLDKKHEPIIFQEEEQEEEEGSSNVVSSSSGQNSDEKPGPMFFEEEVPPDVVDFSPKEERTTKVESWGMIWVWGKQCSWTVSLLPHWIKELSAVGLSEKTRE